MEHIPAFILALAAPPLRGMPGFGTLAHSPGAAAVGLIVVVSSNL